MHINLVYVWVEITEKIYLADNLLHELGGVYKRKNGYFITKMYNIIF